jgi:NADPH-dependent curcumin reductase CurA
VRTQQIVLASRPTGAVEESNFRLVETELPALEDGQLLVRVHYLSLDPYMRRRLDAGPGYAAPVELEQVIVGGTVGEVIESKHEGYQVGDFVVASLGWRTHAISDGTAMIKVDPKVVPLSAYLGVVGMPGVTAHYGLFELGNPRAGETVVVSAAAGAVGSAVGQLAKLRGCRAVGIAGGPTKCAYVVSELGFDACVDYRAPDFVDRLADATPNGIDVDFENVGGPVMDAILARLNPFARVALCGVISNYDGAAYGLRNYPQLLTNRVRLHGFIISDHMAYWPSALQELATLVATGKLRYRESIAEGLENAPRAFIGMLRGENLGKQLVKLA